MTGEEVRRYPTGEPLIDELTEFCAARLKTIYDPAVPRIPALSEDWWVEDRLAEGRRFPVPKMNDEQSLRFCYRWARGQFLHPDLVLHQMTELLPTMIEASKNIFEEKRREG